MAVGVAPIDFANKSSESALSIYPLAIANCKEKRSVLNLHIYKFKCSFFSLVISRFYLDLGFFRMKFNNPYITNHYYLLI